MRHRIKDKQLGRNTKQRKALLRELLRALFERGQIVTTQAKAKEVRRLADKLIHKAQNDSLSVRRQLHKFFGKRDVVNTLVDRVAPAFKTRKSGFTSLKVQGHRRGDNTLMVTLALIEKPEGIGSLKNPKPAKISKKSPKRRSLHSGGQAPSGRKTTKPRKVAKKTTKND